MNKRKLRAELEAELEKVRAGLEKALGQRVSERGWEMLVAADYAREVAEGTADLAYLVQVCKEEFGPVPHRGQGLGAKDASQTGVGEDWIELRLDAISRLVAQEATLDYEVCAFRSEILGGRVLGIGEELDQWLKGVSVHIQERLLRVAEALSEGHRGYGWSKTTAAIFILTGWPPSILPSIYATSRHSGLAPLGSECISPNIVLVVDPALSPRAVADFYRAERQKVLGKRYRALTRKLTALAAFLAPWRPAGSFNEYLNNWLTEATWAKKMELWNTMNPQWRYTSVSNFSRAFYQAKRRLLRLPYEGRAAKKGANNG